MLSVTCQNGNSRESASRATLKMTFMVNIEVNLYANISTRVFSKPVMLICTMNGGNLNNLSTKTRM